MKRDDALAWIRIAGYRITTGSDQGHLSHLIATAIADGMLGFEQKDRAN